MAWLTSAAFLIVIAGASTVWGGSCIILAICTPVTDRAGIAQVVCTERAVV
jgi:hypothetical protein